MVHKLPSKYFPLRKHQENNKGVAMAMEASLHPETKGLHQKWIDNIQFWVDLFPEWFPENWIPGKWLIGTTVGAFSLEESLAYKYTTLEAMHREKFPNEPMTADIHLIVKPLV
jgi:hypothetical protein